MGELDGVEPREGGLGVTRGNVQCMPPARALRVKLRAIRVSRFGSTRTYFGGLVLGCIEADFLQASKSCALLHSSSLNCFAKMLANVDYY